MMFEPIVGTFTTAVASFWLITIFSQLVTYDRILTFCRHIHGSSSQFLEYACPIFKGLVITVSGLDSEERNQVKKAVEAEGGGWSGRGGRRGRGGGGMWWNVGEGCEGKWWCRN